MTRREFLKLAALTLPAAAGADAIAAQSRLRVSQLAINPAGKCRFAQISDWHYCGDEEYMARVVDTLNRLEPAFVCFTGDLVENRKFALEALDFVRQIKAPVYGIPGNHDYLSHAPFDEYEQIFAKTGGEWIAHRSIVLREYDLELTGLAITGMQSKDAEEVSRHILLMHYPVMADHLGDRHFDLVLAGHSHGGQVRLPFYGAVSLPAGVGRYDYGRYETPAGPLYVNAGVGTLTDFPYRFNCPPEITVVTI